MAELVDALDSKSSSARSAGSIPARGTNRAFVLIRQRSLSPIITVLDCISVYGAVRLLLLVSGRFVGVVVGRSQECWYRDFWGIEPMPVKNDTYFRHLKPGEKDYKRSDITVWTNRCPPKAKATRSNRVGCAI